MALPPASQDVFKDRSWRIALGVVAGALSFAYLGVIWELLTLWTSEADYSHGLLLVPFACYLLWTRRDLIPPYIVWPDYSGLGFLAVSAVMYFVAERFNKGKEWLQAFSMITAFLGVVVMFFGRWKALVWAWPAAVFIPMAFKLPFFVERAITLRLRTFATIWGGYSFQTAGLPAYVEGNTIIIGETRLGVEQACSGLSMILAFLALASAIAFLYKSRPWVDRAIIFATAMPIALLCNMIRIFVTGLVYHAGWKELGDKLVHDVAGWLMMPLALGMLWLVIKAMDWVTEPVENINATEALGLGSQSSGRMRRPSGGGPMNPLAPRPSGP
ncbi:MAG: exosortase/archaeosortase family protein [Fimbriiglobus sp.]